jgi:hypothetical protein
MRPAGEAIKKVSLIEAKRNLSFPDALNLTQQSLDRSEIGQRNDSIICNYRDYKISNILESISITEDQEMRFQEVIDYADGSDDEQIFP